MAALDKHGLHPAAGTLFDLMRTEQNLVDALRVIRRTIELVLAAAQAGGG